MSRFVPERDMELTVTQLALGMSVRAGRLYTRRNTLEEIGRNAVEYAKQLTDARLPSTTTGGGRNINYPFRSRRDDSTYRSSFYSRISTKNGRLGIEVGNTHANARTVEFGNDGSGPIIQARKGSMLAIPITDRFYKKLSNKKNLSRGKRLTGGKRNVSYPMMGSDGPYWMREHVHAYSGYGIMRDVLKYIARELA